ncbi:MAG TPA: hypothetical protein GX709_00390 [Clostridiales bacterium]|nr:hypothetical protein [Clostridiales bacterium]
MKIVDVAKLLNAEIVAGDATKEKEVTCIFASDLMSDVLAFARDEDVLISGLSNPQLVRTAALLDMHCIILVRGKAATDDIISLCDKKGIACLTTKLGMYEACGLLFQKNLIPNKAKSK